ncbi:MAG: TROVE domain-containing protein [Bacteroidaceae bacterium]|nr:TROVE domain-containing protein [Bacteroidaceae bacterium]
MSKLNPTTKGTALNDKEHRLAGGFGRYAARQDNVAALKRVVMANLLWEDIAYIDGVSVADEIKRLIPLCDAREVYDIALEARKKQKLRHTPLFIAVEMCRYDEHKRFVAELLPRIITRADMLTDFLALYWKANPDKKKTISHAAMTGLAEAFHNFDEYQFAKYDRETEVKLRDVMFLCHPKPKDETEEALFKKIAERTLETPDTWEVALSSGEDKKAAWTRLIKDGKLGGLAMLRNIANMRKAEVEKQVIDEGIANLKSSMLLPFDFLKARNMNMEFEREIEDAMLCAYERMPKLEGRTLFIVDVSGSMGTRVSRLSDMTRLQCAEAMAMLAANQCEQFELVCTAGNDSTRVGASEHILYPKRGFGLIGQIEDTYSRLHGGGIFTRQCIEWCRKNIDGDFDRIIIFSDSQDCDYPDKRTPNPYGKHNYICDVSCETHGVNFKSVWTAEISGFSEHFLSYIAANEDVTIKPITEDVDNGRK